MADEYTASEDQAMAVEVLMNGSGLDVSALLEEGEQFQAGGGGGITDFDIYMGFWLPGIIAILGILGNSLALLVLSRDTSRSATFVSLKALASSDIILLVGALAQQVVPMFCKVTESVDEFCLSQGYSRVYSWPIVCIAQMLSIWLVLLISAERFVAICYPLRAARLCTLNRVRFLILLILLLAIVFNIPKFFEFVPEVIKLEGNLTEVGVGDTPLRRDEIYRYLYNTALYCLVIYAVPLSTLTVFNVKLVKEIQKAKKNWQLLNRSQKREMKATKLPLVIVLVYFICGTQSLIAFILDAIFVSATYPWLQVYTAIVNLLVIINSAVNFLLMYFFGQRFRKLLMEMLCCKKPKLLSPSTREGFV